MITFVDFSVKWKRCIRSYLDFLDKASQHSNPFNDDLYLQLRQTKLDVTDLLDLKQQVLPHFQNNQRYDDLQDVLTNELAEMEQAIKLAADKIGVSLDQFPNTLI